MASDQTIFRATDRQIVDAFKAICDQLGVNSADFVFALFAQGHPTQISTDLAKLDNDENLAQLLERDSVLLQSHMLRLPTQHNLSVQVIRAEPYDTVRVNIPQEQQLGTSRQIAMLVVEITIPGIGKVVLNRRQMNRLRRDIERGRIKIADEPRPTGD